MDCLRILLPSRLQKSRARIAALEGSRMRLKRISLFALLSVAIMSGCSASRNAKTPLRDSRDRVTEPPRHDHEYSPAPDQSKQFQDHPAENAPSEPIPAPPALGISRVKSVSWLKDLGSKFHRKPGNLDPPCSDAERIDNCSDEELVGKCSEIEPCVSEPGRVDRYKSLGCKDGSVPQASLLSRFRKSASRIFHRPKPVVGSDECGSAVIGSDSCTRSPARESTIIQNRPPCGEAPFRAGCTEQIRQGCGSELVRSATGARRAGKELHSARKKECLAEPFVESILAEEDPGLITPGDRPRHETIEHFNPIVAPPATAAPHKNQAIPVPEAQVPDAPGIPAIPQPSSQIVEPPAWPRLNNTVGMSSVSKSTVFRPATPATNTSHSDVPLIIPKARQ